MKGLAYVFLRKDGAPLPPGCAGHTGWGFLAEASGTCYFGATENPQGSPFVAPGRDNGWWGALGDERAMIARMLDGLYDGYKVATVRDCDPVAARAAADRTRTAGYRAIGSNCLDHTYQVLAAYGVDDLPWLQIHPSPNDWFALFNGEYRNL